MKRIRIGRNSWGHLGMGSYSSMVAILLAFAVDRIANWMGYGDAWWIQLFGWVAILLLLIDVGIALLSLTPRRRWERVMGIGLATGAGLLIAAAILYFFKGKGGELPLWLAAVGVGIAAVMGGGGYLLLRRTLKELNGKLLDRKFKRKRDQYE
uniref:hypothetical protein n=1 Tax=Alistipes sp. TaxID=1872444 RepID=UPI0040568D19